MEAASWPREEPLEAKLMEVDGHSGAIRSTILGELPSLLRPGDLLVVNDSGTLPASLSGVTSRGEAVELRLATLHPDDSFTAVSFGAGDWRSRTEDRPEAPLLTPGDQALFRGGLRGTVEAVDARSPRLLQVRFDREGAALWSALYAAGEPVQYSYLRGPLRLWHVETPYAGRPWSMEAPSAGLALRWQLLERLRARGVEAARLTHGAGLSSTGEAELDALFPLPERYDIPLETVRAIREAKGRAGRVIAVGTTVVRALEGSSAGHGGELEAGEGVTSILLSAGSRRRVVDGLLTGIHDPAGSHYRLLQAFAPAELLGRAYRKAEAAGFQAHEFGDAMLLLPA